MQIKDPQNILRSVLDEGPEKLTLEISGVQTEMRLLVASDLHCNFDDKRGIPFQQYTARMNRCSVHRFFLLEDAIQQAIKDVGVDYIVLEEHPVCLYDNRNGKPYSAIAMDPIPTYITDIMNASTEQSFCGTIHTVQNVLYFNDDTVNRDAIVYYITSGGTFVRFYESWQSTPVEYTLEEFQSDAKAYCAFLEYHIENRNKDEDISIGPLPVFLYFTEDPEGAYENSRYRHIPWTERYPWALPGIICVTLVTFTPLVFLLSHKIIKKRTPKYE